MQTTRIHVRGPLASVFISALSVLALLLNVSFVNASATSNFTQTINAGTVTVDIVDGSYSSVGSPAVAMSATTFSFGCATSTGTFGTASQQIYVTNPDASDDGWTITLAASDPTDVWDSATVTDMDFNDATISDSCPTDGADADSVGGRMQVDPSGATSATGTCGTCTLSNISLGSSAQFTQGSVDSITLVTAASGSDDIGDWTFRGIAISQAIPKQQPAAADYDIDMVVSITAS